MTLPTRLRVASTAVTVSLLVLSACTLAGGATTTTTTVAPTPTTTTQAFPDLPPTSVVTTSLPAGVDPEAAATSAVTVEELMVATQQLRALEFLERPRVQIVDATTMESLLFRLALAPLEDPAFAVEQQLQQMLGMLPKRFSARSLYRSYYESQPVAIFEESTNTLHVLVQADGFSPLEESAVVREVVRALAAEYFGVATNFAGAVPTAVADGQLAIAALQEGDATYFQLLYLQSLTVEERGEAAVEAERVGWTAPGGTPRWLIERLAFPYDDGFVFVSRLVEGGGIAALDQAYADPPQSSEQILHPERYIRGDAVRVVDQLDVDLAGYQVHSAGRFGELAWRALLSRTLDPGLLTQTADGWDGDSYVAVFNSSNVGIVIQMDAVSMEDAIEYAQALIAHARETLAAGEGADVDGGILFDEGGPYVFIDRVDTRLLFVVATSASLGSQLKAAAAAN